MAAASASDSASPDSAPVSTPHEQEALAAWGHRLYDGPGYWNPLRPDPLAETHLADTAQLAHLATAAAQLITGKPRRRDRTAIRVRLGRPVGRP